MTFANPLLGIAGTLALGAVSPGPSFVLVARTAAAHSRTHGLYASVGMGVGGVIFALAALSGLRALLAAVPMLYLAMKVAGGAYLFYLGWLIWLGARQPLASSAANAESTHRTPWHAFSLALATQLSNPKTAIVYASVFSAFLPRVVPDGMLLEAPLTVFMIETSWYALVALGLSSPRARAGYLRCKAWVDRAAGGLMVLLGVKLVSIDWI
jgi:threonine/homoserine/homoserine lactone efflux protein